MNVKRISLSLATAAVIVAIPATTFAGFFPADRPTFTCDSFGACAGADHVTFNSFTNNPVVGDERPFLAGSLNGANVADRIKVKDGDEVVLRMYVHNNADSNVMGEAATAHGVKVKVVVPTAKQKDTNLIGFISATNATPGTINDTMSLYGDNAFTVAYVPGTAVWEHKADGVNMGTYNLADTIAGSGAFLGDLKGCFQYSGYVTLKVKVHMDTPPVTTTTTTTTTPPTKELPNTGAGNVAAMFAGVSVAAGVAHSIFRRTRREF